MKLLGISGALRKGSTNTMLIKEAARLSSFDELVLADLRMPLYDGDLEAAEGIPQIVQDFAQQIADADAILFSTPEYNGNLPGVLKNALDWVSRVEGVPMKGKPVAIVSAAAGGSGGARAQYSLRACLVAFQGDVLPAPEVMIGASFKAFDDNGQLVNEDSVAFLSAKMEALAARV